MQDSFARLLYTMNIQGQKPYYESRDGVFTSFREMIQEIVEYRELLFQMTLRDVRIRYKQAVMGFGWAIFMPMMIVAAGLLIKMVMAQMYRRQARDGRRRGYDGQSFAWSFSSVQSVLQRTASHRTAACVTKIYFPREIFPLSAI